jgi:hypothetical protein
MYHGHAGLLSLCVHYVQLMDLHHLLAKLIPAECLPISKPEINTNMPEINTNLAVTTILLVILNCIAAAV